LPSVGHSLATLILCSGSRTTGLLQKQRKCRTGTCPREPRDTPTSRPLRSEWRRSELRRIGSSDAGLRLVGRRPHSDQLLPPVLAGKYFATLSATCLACASLPCPLKWTPSVECQSECCSTSPNRSLVGMLLSFMISAAILFRALTRSVFSLYCWRSLRSRTGVVVSEGDGKKIGGKKTLIDQAVCCLS
jgi:hypothetical protein